MDKNEFIVIHSVTYYYKNDLIYLCLAVYQLDFYQFSGCQFGRIYRN